MSRSLPGLAKAILALAVLCARPAGAQQSLPEPVRTMIEADWERQDGERLREIREPGVLRFPGAQVSWPGAAPAGAQSIPRAAALTLDGRLDEPGWRGALVLPAPAPEEPALRLCHDGKRLYVGATFPTAREWRFRGDGTAADAGGAVDGVKDGRYAFHTGWEPNPWWQADLGRPQQIARLVVYNRLDYAPGLHYADLVTVLTSDDGAHWTLRYDNKGKHFGGMGDGGPLQVAFPRGEVTARFVRLQLPAPNGMFLHLDEVEVYGFEEPDRNLALRRPAAQSSLSVWSRGGPLGSALFQYAGTSISLALPEGTGDGGPEAGGRRQEAGGQPEAGAEKAPSQPSGLLANGQPLTEGAVHRQGDTTFIEVALPLRGGDGVFPREIVTVGGAKTPLCVGGDWKMAWHAGTPLGFGRNRALLDLEAGSPLSQPVEVVVEATVFTPKRAEQAISVPVQLSRPGPAAVEFRIAHEGAAVVTVRARQGDAEWSESRSFLVAPVQETLQRGQRLLADFGLPAPAALAGLRARAGALARREANEGPDNAARVALYREARWQARDLAFRNPRLRGDGLLFVKRFTQQSYADVCLNHMPWVSRPGGDICVLSPLRPDGKVRPLLKGALGPGHVHGLDLWWDAGRVVFGYARAKSDRPADGWTDRARNFEMRLREEPIHIYEMGIDGKRPRQLTRGEWSDLDPTYLPNGNIAFVSERCGYSLQCNEYDKDETSCNLYVMRPDGTGIKRLSVNKDGDYLPHTLDNGLIGYTRWEYHERTWANIQSLWVVRPDGTQADAAFKQHFNDPWAVEEARSIPGSRKLVAIATGHHTLPAGPVILIDPEVGINEPAGIRIVTPGVPPPEGGMSGAAVPQGGVMGRGGAYMHPWPLSEKHFLVSYAYGGMADEKGYALYLIDVYGTRELVYRDPGISCFQPIPLRPRPRPPVLPEATSPKKHRDAVCFVTNVHEGVEGLKPGTIRYLRIAEPVGWPYDNHHGGQRYEADVKSVMLNWNPVRVIGTVPIAPDGTAYFRVPADRAVYFQALDKDQMEVVRMRSFISFQPGETRSCTGCHETRWHPPFSRRVGEPRSGRVGDGSGRVTHSPTPPLSQSPRRPVVPVPPPWGHRPLSFLRDVQPVLDRHCVRCHDGLKPAGGLDFSGGLTARYNRAFDTVQAAQLVSRSNVGDDARITKPLSFGSHRSKLIAVIRGSHRDRVTLDADSWLRLVTWVDANAPYHDGFLNKRVVQPYDLTADAPAMAAVQAVHARRCAACHAPADITRVDWVDLREPARSRFLAAPLAKADGGTGRCGGPVYQSDRDPDYRSVRAVVEEMARKAWERPRRDLAALERPKAQASR